MDRETVNVIDHAGADAGGQRGLAVGRKAAGAYANDGRAFRDRGTANRRGRGCQTSLPRIRRGAPDPNRWNAETRSDIFRPLDRPHERRMSRYCVGVRPNTARNVLLKVERSPKPKSSAMAITGRREDASASAARRSRALMRY